MFFILFLPLLSCKPHSGENDGLPAEITAEEVMQAQLAWGEGIVGIGEIYSQGGDYVEAASEHIRQFYAYQAGQVLFKPTLASENPFRLDFQGALSYFTGNNPDYEEDHGFAIKPWSHVHWESAGILVFDGLALSMGRYYFSPASGGDAVEVEYSFAWIRGDEGELKIVLHDSHLPYRP